MLNTLHLDADGKTARILFQSLPATRPRAKPRLVTSSGEVAAYRVTNGLNLSLDPAQLNPMGLSSADPEIIPGNGGEILDPDSLSTAFFDPTSANPVPLRDFREIDIVYDANGIERERRPHVQRKSNIDDLYPVKLGKRYPIASALTSFVFKRIYQLAHEDGLTRDFLFQLAKDLHETQQMVLLGAGPKGNQPLVIRDKGTPYRAFLYGEIGSGDQAGKYKLLLLLTDQELKRPEPANTGEPQ
jgi:hypothetical protein